MERLKDISFWAKSLGHLPIHLTPETPEQFILLNGVQGNFCLDFSNFEETRESYFSKSWSSNTKNFIRFEKNNLKLFNWHMSQEEEIPLNFVNENFSKFYKYLISKSQSSNRDVVPVVIDIFKQFRTLTRESKNPTYALNLLFLLLAGLEEDIGELDKEKWSISDISLPSGFDAFVDRFKQGIENIKPNLSLILRHSSGALFQEAQREVLFFDNQPDLFGTFSAKNKLDSLLYSSIHYTPTYLARTIVENAIRQINLEDYSVLRILDPACGSSEFLIEALKQLKEKKFKGKIEIFGYDTSETAIQTSKFLLTYEKRENWGDSLTSKVSLVEDSLTHSWNDQYDLILMNPPFISWELLKDKNKREAVRETLGANFKGKPNQASAFFYKAINHLQSNGVLGCVMPSTLFTLDSYAKLRNEVNQKVDIELLGKLGNFVFKDALTDVSIFVGKKPSNESNVPTILWTRNEKGLVHESLRELRKLQYNKRFELQNQNYSIYKPERFPIINDEWKTVSLEEYNWLKSLNIFIANEKLTTIGEMFNVTQGVRPGNKKTFVISPIEYDKIPNDEKDFFYPCINNDSINNGVIKNNSFVWYPYDIKSGDSLLNSEEDLKQTLPYVYEQILCPNKSELLNRRKKVPYWWSLSDRAPRLLPIIKSIISTEFGNSSSFAINEKPFRLVERGNAWIPKKEMTDDDLYFYLSLFSSPFFDSLLSIYSRQLLSGWDLGKKYTKQIPIPNVQLNDVKYLDAYIKMVELGKRLSQGETYVKSILNDIVSIYYPEIKS